MEAIMAIAKEHNLYVIEDNAQAIGAKVFYWNQKRKRDDRTRRVNFILSSKNLGCYGDGGAIFTNDDALAHKTAES
jgi:dTDP-4-amino-4,6-dideoxygalactose transaminase